MLQRTRIILVGFFLFIFLILFWVGFCSFVFIVVGVFPYPGVRSVYKSRLPEIRCELLLLLVMYQPLHFCASWSPLWCIRGQILPLTKMMHFSPWKSESVTQWIWWNGASRLSKMAAKRVTQSFLQLTWRNLVSGRTLQLPEGFSQREGGGLVSSTYFSFQNEMGASFLCLLWCFFVGKNREVQHEFMLCTCWYQIISFWSFVLYFYLGWGRASAARI